MNEHDDDQKKYGNSALFISAEGLKGKQSVRATFRLPNHLIDLLGLVAAQLGLKQKSLFDQLIEDAGVLEKVAEKVSEQGLTNGERRQKTFVLSKRSLQVLDMVARQSHVSRDVLVEVSIKRLLPLMNAEQERQKKRTVAFHEMESYLQQGRKLLQRAERLLGRDDRCSEIIRAAVESCGDSAAALRGIIEKGQSVENYEAPGEPG
ncbi:MAG: hypothetical protein KJ950_00885 [Proteobacteria bacterium]|nr:hypothetical protein [Pseudomonadota bacterium]MBU1687857.1 hypothetical protein [Pseudomonadota bacterium]